jgi:predicted porin
LKPQLATALALATLSVAAHAQQSSVTVYGSLDGGVDYVSNAGGHSDKAVNTGRRSPDRFGFRGTEDLGAGLGAFFRIENGFNTDTGTSTRPTVFWNRFAQVGLQQAGVGSATLGHMPDFMYEYLAQHSNALPGISGFFSPGNLDNLANQFQFDNAVKFESAEFGGFQAGAMAGLSETAGVKNNRGFGLQYRSEALKVSAAYSMAANRPVDVRGLFGVTSLLGQPVAAGSMFNARRFRSAGIGASYTLGLFTPHLLVTDVSLGNDAGRTSERNVHAGVVIDVSGGKKVDTVHVSYGRSTFLDRRFNELNLFASHAFSRRTQVYAAVGHQRADNTTAGLFGYTKSSTDTQTVVRIGVQNMF